MGDITIISELSSYYIFGYFSIYYNFQTITFLKYMYVVKNLEHLV